MEICSCCRTIAQDAWSREPDFHCVQSLTIGTSCSRCRRAVGGNKKLAVAADAPSQQHQPPPFQQPQQRQPHWMARRHQTAAIHPSISRRKTIDAAAADELDQRRFDSAAEPTDEDIPKNNLAAIVARPSAKSNNAKPPAARNSRPDVGNCTMTVGNLGMTSTERFTETGAVRDRQILWSPGQIVVLFEAIDDVQGMLEIDDQDVAVRVERPQLRQAGEQAAFGNVVTRHLQEHIVVIGCTQKKPVLMAACHSVCSHIQIVMDETWIDGHFNAKPAETNIMVCDFELRQRVRYLGTQIRVMGVHGHHDTMHMKVGTTATDEWWDKLSNMIYKYRPHFLVGDFNVSLIQVVPRLKARGLPIATVAWHPWIYKDRSHGGSHLGMDSCGIFHIPCDVQCTPKWSINNVGLILRKAACAPSQWDEGLRVITEDRSSGTQNMLDVYSGESLPCKLWTCYNSNENDEHTYCFWTCYDDETGRWRWYDERWHVWVWHPHDHW